MKENNSPSFEHIQIEFWEKTGIIYFNRENVFNSMNKVMKKEIIKALSFFQKEADIRCLIIRAKGKAFCAGQDLNDRSVSEDNPQGVNLAHTLKTEWNPLVTAMRKCSLPIIGVIEGTVAGAGVSVALACDFLFSLPEVKWVSGFSKINLICDAGSSFSLVRILGYQRAMEFALRNKPFSSEDFYKAGFINGLNESPFEEAKVLASELGQLSPLTLMATKRSFHYALEHNFKDCLDYETACQGHLGSTEDYKEGVMAFKEKRKPCFQGK